MKAIILICAVLVSKFSLGQCGPWSWNNLVSNNSWEEVNYNVWYYGCAVEHSNFGKCSPSLCTDSQTDANRISDYWAPVANWGVPNEKNFVANPWIGSPDLVWDGLQNNSSPFGYARSGEYHMSAAREAVVIELEEPLVPGCQYYIELFSKSNAVGFCSVSAYDRYPKHWNAEGRNIEQSNSSHFEYIYTWDTNDPEFDDWHKVSTFLK